MNNGSNVESAAIKVLKSLLKTADGAEFTQKQIQIIAKAICEAIDAYDQVSRCR